MERKGASKGEIVTAIMHFAAAARQKGKGKDAGKAGGKDVAEGGPPESGGGGGSKTGLPAAFANVRPAIPVEVGPVVTPMAAAPPPPPPPAEPIDLRDLVYFHLSCFAFSPNLSLTITPEYLKVSQRPNRWLNLQRCLKEVLDVAWIQCLFQKKNEKQ